MKKHARTHVWMVAFSCAVLFFGCDGGADHDEYQTVNDTSEGPATEEEMFGWIKDLCAMGYRRPGTEADHQASQYILGKFKEFRLENPHLEPIPTTLCDVSTWSLTVKGEQIPCSYIPYTEFTGPDGRSSEIVYLNEGSAWDFVGIDVKGKIVVVEMRFLYLNLLLPSLVEHPHTYDFANWEALNRAVEQGAVGFVGILNDYWDLNTYYAPIDYPSEPLFKAIPGLWVSETDGAHLLDLIEDEEKVEATIVLDGSVGPGVTSNVVGFLSGMTEDIIMVHSHHDSTFYGAVQDASGVSEVLALAKYFGQLPQWSREKTLMFFTSAGHMTNYLGTTAFVETHKDDLITKIVVDLCLEHIAKDYDYIDGELVDTGRAELSYIFATDHLPTFAMAAVRKHNLDRTVVIPTPHHLYVTSDAYSFHKAGIPIVSFISSPEYMYDLIDTPDMVAKDRLVPVAEVFIDLVKWLDASPGNWK